MARLLTVPSGWGTPYSPTTDELRTLAVALSGTSAAINQAAESFSVEYPTASDVLAFINGGGIYVDYCGWPMYWPVAISAPYAQSAPRAFGDFLASMGADRYYCDGFDSSGCMPTYPYNRGWLCGFNISSSAGLIYGQSGAQCPASVFSGGDTAYPMVAVRSTGGSGVYVYGAVGSYGAIDPNRLAQFVLSVISSVPSTGSGNSLCPPGYYLPPGQLAPGGCVPQTGIGQAQCVAGGGTWQNGVCYVKQGTVTPTTPVNWPLIIGGGLVGLGVIIGLVVLASGGE